jgi:type II secretory pathway pseudopilin PulG
MKNSKNGLTLIETLATCLILGFLMLSTVGMLSSAFNAEINIEKNIKTKQVKLNSIDKIISKAREASAVYYSNNPITIPIKGTNVTITPETQALVVLVPKFNSSGAIIQPSANVTTFQGLAFSIVPKSTWDSTCNGPYVLLETNMDINLSTTTSDPLKINQTFPTSWSGSTTNLLADNLFPATTTMLTTTAFDIESDIVSFSLTPQESVIYFPSPNGTKSINDSQYVSSFQFRNFRIE